MPQTGRIEHVGMGAALEFVEQFLGGPVTQIETAVSVTNVLKQLLNNNGDRVGLLIINLGQWNVNIAPIAARASADGIPLVAAGGFMSLNVRDDFTLAAREWYAAQGNAGGSTLFILEYVRVSRNLSVNPEKFAV